MAMDPSADRVDHLFTRVEQPPYYGGASSGTAYSYQVPRQPYPIESPTFNAESLYSTASNDSRPRRESISSSNYTSSSSNATSIPLYPPPPAPLPYNLPYELVCEFGFMGCQLRFQPSDVEAWIRHSISHFTAFHIRPPPRAICTFCDESDGVFENKRDLESNWRKRMRHIAGHFARLQPQEQLRPDFGVVEHVRKFISVEDYERAQRYSERPRGCPGMGQTRRSTNSFERGEEQGGLKVSYNPRKEDRERKKRRGG